MTHNFLIYFCTALAAGAVANAYAFMVALFWTVTLPGLVILHCTIECTKIGLIPGIKPTWRHLIKHIYDLVLCH